MEAVRLKQVDLDYRTHLVAWLTFAAKAEKKSGRNKSKPVYSKFSRFYDYEEAQKKAQGKQEKSRFAGIGKLLNKGV
jgi:hypothetical protein